MNTKPKLFLKSDIHKDIIKFAMVGAISTIIDIAVLNLTYSGIGMGLYRSTFLGFLAGSINGYILNNKWTFKKRNLETKISGLIQYTIVGSVGLAMTEIIMHYGVEIYGYDHNLTKLSAVFVTLIWNFFINRAWTFAEKTN